MGGIADHAIAGTEKIGLTLVWIIGFEWVFALQARFENAVGRTLTNAFVFGISFHILLSIVGMIVLDAIWAMLAACWFLFPQGLFLVGGYGVRHDDPVPYPVVERGLHNT